MARLNERPERRSARDERSHAEPVLSFDPRADTGEESEPSLSGEAAAPPAKPRAPRSQARDQEPPTPQAPKPSVAGADRPLYLYMPPPKRHGGAFAAKLVALMGIAALIGAYAWHRYEPAIDTSPSTADDLLPALAQPQPLSSATYGAPNPSSLPTQQVAPAPVAQAPQPPTSSASTSAPSAPPAQPSPPAAAANPPPQPVASAPAVSPAPPQAPAVAAAPPPKHDTVKRETPHRDVSLDQAKPRDQAKLATPAPSTPVPPPPVVAASPPVSAPVAAGKPRPLNQTAPSPQREAALPPVPQPSFVPPAPSPTPLSPAPTPDSGPASGPNAVTVDGVTYVDGQEPHALGTIGDATAPAAGTAAASPAFVPPQSTAADTMRPYVPRDTNSGVAPLPNDVIILPSGQMAVPSGQQ